MLYETDAFAEIFEIKPAEPLSEACIDYAIESIKDSLVDMKLKAAGIDSLHRAPEMDDVIRVLAAVLGEKDIPFIIELIENQEYLDRSPQENRWEAAEANKVRQRNARLQANRNRTKSEDKNNAEAAVASKIRASRDPVQERHLLENRIRFDNTLNGRQKSALLNILGKLPDEIEKLERLRRLTGLLSRAHRAEDKTAKREQASTEFIELCERGHSNGRNRQSRTKRSGSQHCEVQRSRQ